jgi:hypothetical protein
VQFVCPQVIKAVFHDLSHVKTVFHAS